MVVDILIYKFNRFKSH